VEKVLFDIGHPVLDPPFFLRWAGHRPGLKAVMVGEIQVMRIKRDGAARRLKTATLQLSTQTWRTTPPKYSKRAGGRPEMLQRFGQRELQIHFAAEGQHHDKKGQPALGGSHRHRPGATPVHLGALAGLKVQRQKGRRSLGRTWRTNALRML